MIEKVIKDLAVKEKDLQAFEDRDPINRENILNGFLCRRPDHRYGALAITHINGKDAYQIRYGTPKQHYPFGKDGEFHFPEAKEICMRRDGSDQLFCQCAFGYDWHFDHC